MCHFSRIDTILVDLDFPLRVGVIYICQQHIVGEVKGVVALYSIGVCTLDRTSSYGIATIEAHLVRTCVHSLIVAHIVPIREGVTLADEYVISVWGAVARDVCRPPRTANRVGVMLENFVRGAFGRVLVELLTVDMTRENVCLLILIKERKYRLNVVRCAIEELNVNTKYHHLILRYKCQILLQPLNLLR